MTFRLLLTALAWVVAACTAVPDSPSQAVTLPTPSGAAASLCALVGHTQSDATGLATPAAPWTEADMRASRTAAPGTDSVPRAQAAVWWVVYQADDCQLTVIDITRAEVVERITSRPDLIQDARVSPDGRSLYVGSRDGWVTQYDLRHLALVAEIRVGRALRHLALSSDGRVLATASDAPSSLVLLSADLQPLKQMAVGTLDGKQTSRIAALRDAPPRKSFVAALEDAPELWEISYNEGAAPIFDGYVHDYRMGEAIAKPGYLTPRRTPLDEPLESFAFDPSYRNLLGAKRPRDGAPAVSTTVQVVNLDVRRKIAELPMAGMPQPGSGIRFAHHGTTVLASQNLQDGVIDVIDMKTWKVVKAIPTPGPGFFIRSHENTPFAWADSVIDPKSKDSLTLIDKKTLEPVATLRKPGHTLAQTAFTKDGRYALVSAADMDGALIAFDTETLKEIKRLPMRKPVGSYNVWNMITRSKRPSH